MSSTSSNPPPHAAAAPPARIVSLDAYRGFVMLAMASSGLAFETVVRNHRDTLGESAVWRFLARQFSHVDWIGCSFWDLIQPSFMFIVGVAVPFSMAAYQARGVSRWRVALRTVFRSIVLVGLGVLLASDGKDSTNWLFTNVLAQIGLGYAVLVLLNRFAWPVHTIVAILLLGGVWAAFYYHPLPEEPVDFRALDFFATRPNYQPLPGTEAWAPLEGWRGHWNPSVNAATAFDLWLMESLPRAEQFNPGGYQTLNFVPSLVTMLIGLMAGQLLRGEREGSDKVARLFVAGVFLLAAGWLLGDLACPLVKRIWTPSWTLFSAGWTLLLLCGFYLVVDVGGFRLWTFPLVVVGMNSIAIYLMSQVCRGWIRNQLRTHLAGLQPWLSEHYEISFGKHVFDWTYGPIFESLAILLVLWLTCFWMYRRKIFLRL